MLLSFVTHPRLFRAFGVLIRNEIAVILGRDAGWDEKRRHVGRNSSHPSTEHAINALAGRQHRAVELEQLIGLGLSASAIRSRVAGGRLHRSTAASSSLVPRH